MSAAADVLSTRVKISDPKPAFCSGCLRGADETIRFVDFDAAFDAGAFVDRTTQAYVEGSDDLHLCENCVREAVERLDLKAELHQNQLREIRRLEIENEHWRDTARRAQAELAKQQEAVNLGRVKGAGRKR